MESKHPDELTRGLKELDEAVAESAGLQRAIDDARAVSIPARFIDRRKDERRQPVERRQIERRERTEP